MRGGWAFIGSRMSPEDQPTIFTPPPDGSRPASGGWQAPGVEEMQAKLPQYEVLEVLGRGGMGAVYKGRQKSLKRLVAIKILPLGLADDEFKFTERFQNEAQTMAAMNHPAIVAVHDFGETPDGLLYFIMEFVDGTDVQKMIQASGRLSGEYALAITAHVCDALAYAHKRDVIHRDIKPANILIDQEGHIKVADFGLAKMHDPSQTSGLTKTNMAMGTPDYVAPEVLSPGMVADHRADIYAVGVMLYQMLTGEVPRGLFKLPSRKGIGSDPRFDEIICKAMEQDREERYQSAMDVRHALDVILTTPQPKDDGTGIVSVSQIPKKPVAKQPRPPGERSQPPPQKEPAPQQAPAQKSAPPPKAKAPPKKKSPATLWLSIGGIVTVLGLASFFALGGKSEPSARVQPVSASPVDAAFLAEVAAAPAARQVELVEQKIEALNGTKVSAEPTITGEKVTGLRLFRADDTEGEVPDVSPLAALKELHSLHLQYLYPTDISCLRGLKLVNLKIWGGNFNDLSVLQSHPLQRLSLKQTQVSDFSMLKDKALQDLDLEWCHRLSDLSFITGLPIKYLNVTKTKVHDLSPIAGLPLLELVCDPDAKLDPALLASIPTLKKINLKPVSEWQGGSSLSPAKPSAQSPSSWTDWLGPKLAKGQFASRPDIVVEKDGITSNQLVTSIPFDKGTVVRGPVRMTYLLRESEWTQVVFSIDPLTNETYRAEDKGSELRLFRAGKDGANQTMLASEKIPAAISRTAERTLEFAVDGNVLRATVNGTFSLSAQDATLATVSGSFHSISFKKGLLLKKVEIAADGVPGIGISKAGDGRKVDAGVSATKSTGSASATVRWTEWLQPRLAKGQYTNNGFIAEEGGLTTDQGMKGTSITADDTVDGTIRLTYLLRDSKCVQITVRSRGSGPTRELYVAEDSGSGLYIGRILGDKTTMLVSEKYPTTISRTGEQTLEFRAEGDTLKATVNGTFSVSARDGTLAKGPSSFVIMRGLLLKKVEIAD